MACIARTSYITWNVDNLESAIRPIKQGVRGRIRIDSIGIDTWGVDFVLLDQQGQRRPARCLSR